MISLERAHEIKAYLGLGFKRDEVLSWFAENQGAVLAPFSRSDLPDFFQDSRDEKRCEEIKRRNVVNLKELEMASVKAYTKVIKRIAVNDFDAENILWRVVDEYINTPKAINGFFQYLEEHEYVGRYLVWFYETKASGQHTRFVKTIEDQRKKQATVNEYARLIPKLAIIEDKRTLSDEDIIQLMELGIESLMAARLRQLEEEHGITQKEIYEALGAPQSTVTDWFNGSMTRMHLLIVKLLRYLRVRLNDDSIDFEWLVAGGKNVSKSVATTIEMKDKEALKRTQFDNEMLHIQLKHQQDLIDQLRSQK